MDVSLAILAGLLGTAVMTALMMLGPRMGMPKMDMLGMMGTMVLPSGGAATALGAVMHFTMGALFGIVYAALWTVGWGAPTWGWGALFGAVHGIVAALVMPLLQRMHPRPVEREGGAMMGLFGILMGHVVFGVVVGLVYR